MNLAGLFLVITAIGIQRVPLVEGRNFIAAPTLPATNTVAGILGTNLPAATTESFATVVDFWDQTTQAFTNRCWLSSAPGYPGWRTTGAFADASTNLVDTTKDFVITIRAGAGPQTLWLTGAIPTNDVTQTVQNNGYTLAGSRFPLPAALVSFTNGFTGGTSLVTSDQLLFHDPVTQTFPVKLWFDTSSQIWRNADASLATNVFQPGQAVLIKRRNRAGNFTWTNPPPYSLTGVYP